MRAISPGQAEPLYLMIFTAIAKPQIVIPGRAQHEPGIQVFTHTRSPGFRVSLRDPGMTAGGTAHA
jgi:hypothetical protein